MYTSMCACVCEIHTIYIYRSLYCLYLVAVLISAHRPLCTFIPVVIYLPAQPHQHHREERPCRDIGRKRTDLSVSQSATRDLSPRHVRLEDTVKHISHRHHDHQLKLFLSFYYRHVTVQLCIRVCEIHTIYIYRSLYCLYSRSTPIYPPHSMPI